MFSLWYLFAGIKELMGDFEHFDGDEGASPAPTRADPPPARTEPPPSPPAADATSENSPQF